MPYFLIGMYCTAQVTLKKYTLLYLIPLLSCRTFDDRKYSNNSQDKISKCKLGQECEMKITGEGGLGHVQHNNRFFTCPAAEDAYNEHIYEEIPETRQQRLRPLPPIPEGSTLRQETVLDGILKE